MKNNKKHKNIHKHTIITSLAPTLEDKSNYAVMTIYSTYKNGGIMVYYASITSDIYYKELYNISKDILKTLIEDILNNITETIYIFTYDMSTYSGVYIQFAIFSLTDFKKEEYKELVHNNGDYISIEYKNLIFRDIKRIIPLDIKDLLKFSKKITNIETIYDPNITNINNEIIAKEELNKITEVTWDVIQITRQHILKDYKIKLSSIYSSSHLAFTVFRILYMDTILPSAT